MISDTSSTANVSFYHGCFPRTQRPPNADLSNFLRHLSTTLFFRSCVTQMWAVRPHKDSPCRKIAFSIQKTPASNCFVGSTCTNKRLGYGLEAFGHRRVVSPRKPLQSQPN